LEEAAGTGQSTLAALQNDMILRTLANTRLFFQSGGSGYCIMIDSNNYIAFNKKTSE
jgi:hypothetical protein